MKYIYNPVTGTLDDVETPNLGEKYFASAETDEIIKTIDDKFGPGTMFPASDAPTPPKTIERDMFDNAFRDNAADGGMMRQDFGDGTITPVKNLSKNITGNNLKLFNEGNLYTLRLGADKTQYFGTQNDLQTIFDARPTSGGDTTLELENKKYSKGYKTKNQFIDFLKTKGIDIQNPAAFASTYSITTKVNPYKANALIYDTSKLKNKTFVENIIKRQVKSGYGTDAQKLQFKKFDNESVMRSYFNALRRKMQKKYSVRKIEEILSANKASGLNLSHMDDLYSQHVTTRNIGYVPKDFNAQDLDKFDKKFREIYKKRNNLFKNKTKGWEAKVAKLNKDGTTLAKASDGFKQFIVKKVDGKTRVVGVDLSKTIDPNDILEGKKIKDLSDEDIDLLIENKNKIIKNTKPGTFKKLLKGFGKKLPVAGVILGINEMANASEMGLNDLESLFIAYQTDADTAMKNMEMKDSPQYNKKTLAGIGGYTGGDELPEIDPYQAAKGGLIPDQEIMNYATGGRVNFQDGTPNPQLDGNDFLNELEFKFNNIDNVTLDNTPITFDDSKSSAAQVADLANPKNIPYYADMAVRAGLRIGEFGTRILPATGQLISDVLQKPMFKVKSSYAREDDNEILDYGETPENNNVKFVGGPIFKNFLKNITPTSTEKLVGLDTIINEEKKKMIERGSSSLPVKVAETAALGGELIAPIFPGLKLLRAYAKSKSLPVNDDTKQLLEQDVDMVLESNGMDRRQFLQITGTGGAVILAKMLGFGDEFATATKVAEKATAKVATSGAPPHFLNLVAKIKTLGDDSTSKYATKDREVVTSYKDYQLTEELDSGRITIQRFKQSEIDYYDEMLMEETYMSHTPGKNLADETTQGKNLPDEYTEDTSYIRTNGPQKGDIVETVDGVGDDVIKEGTKFEDNLSDFGE